MLTGENYCSLPSLLCPNSVHRVLDAFQPPRVAASATSALCTRKERNGGTCLDTCHSTCHSTQILHGSAIILVTATATGTSDARVLTISQPKKKHSNTCIASLCRQTNSVYELFKFWSRSIASGLQLMGDPRRGRKARLAPIFKTGKSLLVATACTRGQKRKRATVKDEDQVALLRLFQG